MKHLGPILIVLIAVTSLGLLTAMAVAGGIEQVSGTIEQSKCTVIARESTTGKALVGGGAGAAAGAVVGSMFGKSGSGWGGLVGAGAGALIGNSMGGKTYQCRLLVKVGEETHLVETIDDEGEYPKGMDILLLRDSQGTLSVL